MNIKLKAVSGLILIAAVLFAGTEAHAEISIDMDIEGYTPRSTTRADEKRRARVESLTEAAASFAAAENGDAAKAETLLASAYAGSVAAEAGPVVYAAARRPSAIAATRAVPVARAKGAMEELEDESADDGAASAAQATGEKPEEATAPEEELTTDDTDVKEESASTFGGSPLAALLGLLIVVFFVLLLL
jgi:hypothetical protein